MSPGKALFLGMAIVSLAACGQRGRENPDSPKASATEARAVGPREAGPLAGDPGQWIGRWNGPEGSYLSISRQGDSYTLEIADLDGARTFPATRRGSQLVFERDGKAETITATDGKQTGMKWLQEFSNCLTVSAGEGYCRSR